MEHPDTPTPRIYVASLSDYNAGRLHGVWIDADQDANDLQDHIEVMLAASDEPGAEEWAIHDFEGFGPLHLSEFESVVDIARIGQGIAEHGMAYAHFAAMLTPTGYGELDKFEDSYQGRWDSMQAYAEDLLDSLGMDPNKCTGLPDMLRPYVSIDVDSFARDLESELWVSESGDGVYVFEP
jgi:antirestriction protein